MDGQDGECSVCTLIQSYADDKRCELCNSADVKLITKMREPDEWPPELFESDSPQSRLAGQLSEVLTQFILIFLFDFPFLL